LYQVRCRWWAGTRVPLHCRAPRAWRPLPYRSATRRTDHGLLDSQLKATLDLCVNVLVRPTRNSPRQSGAARPCVIFNTLRGCKARPDRRYDGNVLQSAVTHSLTGSARAGGGGGGLHKAPASRPAQRQFCGVLGVEGIHLLLCGTSANGFKT
jgi:hypothetical protein